MSVVADQSDNWRGSYDGWLTRDRRAEDAPPADHSPRRPCAACGGGGCKCTPQERDRAYRKRMGWELPGDGG